MSLFQPSQHSYGAPPRRAPLPRRGRNEAAVIMADRRAVRDVKRRIAIALGLALATGGVSALVQAAAKKAGPAKLAHELHAAESKLHYDIARTNAALAGRKSPSLAAIRAAHKEKTPQQAGAEAVAEAADTTGATADANDAAAAETTTADVTDTGTDTPDTSVSVTASASESSTGGGKIILALVVIGGVVVGYKAYSKKVA